MPWTPEQCGVRLMSSIKVNLCLLAVSTLVTLAACGDANKQAVFPHPAGWQTTHKTAGSAYSANCTECHGENLDGGIAKVSCTSCHLGGALTIHPTSMIPALTKHKAYVAANGDISCANGSCHGTAYQGVTGSGPSCTSCHIGDKSHKHPLSWTTSALIDHRNYVNLNGSASCKTSSCHGVNGVGGPNNAPACNTCHEMK